MRWQLHWALHRRPRRYTIHLPPVLTQSPLSLKPKPQKLHRLWKNRRDDEERTSGRKKRGRGRNLVEQNVLQMAIIATKQVIDDGETVPVQDLHLDIDPETQNPITPIILDVGRGHRQVATDIGRHTGYQAMTLSTVTERETGEDGQ